MTGLSVAVVAGTEQTEPFGHSFYRTPINDTSYRLKVGHYNAREKNKCFVDTIAKNLQYIPGPKYMKLPKWPEKRNPE